MKLVVNDISGLPAAASSLLGEHKAARIFALYGEMGAGKTTFIKELCRHLGSEDNIVSPTFTLVNEYRAGSGDPLYHFDFYRINTLGEVYDFGIEEYLTGDFYCFLEWPEKIESLLPPGTVTVRITAEPDGSRIIQL
jgi:tRNA threonylcarbamoyladenosine biosynthesis protein TsaE